MQSRVFSPWIQPNVSAWKVSHDNGSLKCWRNRHFMSQISIADAKYVYRNLLKFFITANFLPIDLSVFLQNWRIMRSLRVWIGKIFTLRKCRSSLSPLMRRTLHILRRETQLNTSLYQASVCKNTQTVALVDYFIIMIMCNCVARAIVCLNSMFYFNVSVSYVIKYAGLVSESILECSEMGVLPVCTYT